MEINGVPISNKNPEIVLKLFFASLISVVIFDILVVLAEDVFFNPLILVLLFVVGTINVIIITILAKFPQVTTASLLSRNVSVHLYRTYGRQLCTITLILWWTKSFRWWIFIVRKQGGSINIDSDFKGKNCDNLLYCLI